MVLDGAVLGDVEQRLRRKLHHIGHHPQVGRQRLHGLVCVLTRQLVQLKHLQAAHLRFHAQGVRLSARFFRAAKHAHHLVATRQKRF